MPGNCGERAREDALGYSYAQQRAACAPTEILMLDADWNVATAATSAALSAFLSWRLQMP